MMTELTTGVGSGVGVGVGEGVGERGMYVQSPPQPNKTRSITLSSIPIIVLFIVSSFAVLSARANLAGMGWN
jgi:hypothetical protein